MKRFIYCRGHYGPGISANIDPAETRALQVVWWGFRDWFSRKRRLPYNAGPYPSRGAYLGAVYRWRFVIGPVEVRRWENRPNRRIGPERRKRNENEFDPDPSPDWVRRENIRRAEDRR